MVVFGVFFAHIERTIYKKSFIASNYLPINRSATSTDARDTSNQPEMLKFAFNRIKIGTSEVICDTSEFGRA